MTETNEYLKTLKPILFTAKICGLFPFVLNKKDSWRELLISYVTFVISLLIYATAFVSCLLVVSGNISRLQKNFSFIYFMRVYAYLNLRIYVLCVPFTVWNKSEKFHIYWKRWNNIQDEFKMVTGSQYKCSRSVVMGIRLMTFITFFSVVTLTASLRFIYTDDNNAMASLSIIMSIWIANATLFYWWANCLYFTGILQHLAKIIRITVDQETDHIKLQKLMSLWIDVCALIDMFSTMHSFIFLFQIVIAMVNTIVALYPAIFQSLNDTNQQLLIGDIMGGFSALMVTSVYCETGYTVHVHLAPKLKEILLNKNNNKMKSDFLTSVRLFLNVIEARNTKISLHGFTYVDRSTFTAAISASINFLIILRQFGSSYLVTKA